MTLWPAVGSFLVGLTSFHLFHRKTQGSKSFWGFFFSYWASHLQLHSLAALTFPKFCDPFTHISFSSCAPLQCCSFLTHFKYWCVMCNWWLHSHFWVGYIVDICNSKVQRQNISCQLVHGKVWIINLFKRAKLCVCVFVFRCNCCNSVHYPFTSSLRCPLEVHGVATQTVNKLVCTRFSLIFVDTVICYPGTFYSCCFATRT